MRGSRSQPGSALKGAVGEAGGSAAFTPGPWFWTGDDHKPVSLRSRAGDIVADPQADIGDYGLSVDRWTDVSAADARLIAAAPDLLEAARALVATDEARRNVQPLYEKACALARAAIAKALGRPDADTSQASQAPRDEQ
jgi:hypothetical protein